MSDADIDIDMNDLAALRKAAPRKSGGGTVKSRAKAEKRVSPTDTYLRPRPLDPYLDKLSAWFWGQIAKIRRRR